MGAHSVTPARVRSLALEEKALRVLLQERAEPLAPALSCKRRPWSIFE